MALLRRITGGSFEGLVHQINAALADIENRLMLWQVTQTPDAGVTQDGTFGEERTYTDGSTVKYFKRLITRGGLPRWWEIPVKYLNTDYTATNTATVSNTTTETSLIGTTSGFFIIPADYFIAGTTLLFEAWGYYSTQATPPTLQIQLKVGSTAVANTSAYTPMVSASNYLWRVNVMMTCRTTGVTGNFFTQGVFEHMVDTVGYPLWWEMGNSAINSLNTTVIQPVRLTATWGTGVGASDTISCTNVVMYAMFT